MAVRIGAGGSNLIVGVAALSLVSGGVVAASAFLTADDGSIECGVSSVRTESEAFALAEACDKDIEIESLRTEYDTFWATPRQTIRADASSGAVRTDLGGAWEPTDATIMLDGDGVPSVTSPVFDMDLAGVVAGGDPFMTIRSDEQALSMSLPDPLGLGEPALDPKDATRVVYPVTGPDGQPIAGADLVVMIQPDATGFTPVLRVADAAAGAGLVEATGEAGLGFHVGVSGGLVLSDQAPEDDGMAPDPIPEDGTPDGAWEDPSEAGGPAPAASASRTTAGEASVESSGPTGFYALDQAGELTFSGSPGWQWESGTATVGSSGSKDLARTTQSGQTNSRDELLSEESVPDELLVEQSGVAAVALDAVIAEDGHSAVIRADEEMVTDPEGNFPMFVDPAVSGSRSGWTVLKQAWPTSATGWKFAGSAGVGFCDVSRDPACDRSNVQRLVWKFSGLSFIGDLDPADVLGATFRAYGTHSFSCTKTTMQLYRTPAISSSTTWSNHAGLWDSSFRISAVDDAYYSSSCGGAHWTEWDATEVGDLIASNGWSGINLGIRSSSNTDMVSWKKLRYDARFSVEYSRAPAAPYGHQTLVDGANVGCSESSSAPRTSRWLRPILSVVGNDPEKQPVSVQFVVVNHATGDWVWESAWQDWQTPPDGSGVRFTLRVPEGKELSNGVTYRWRAQIKDKSGRSVGYGDSKACYFRVDNSAPAAPVITPVRDHPDAEAFYETDKERGGLGLTGCFEIYAPSTDSTTVWWGYATRTNTTKVTLDSTRRTTVCASPGGTGPKFLYAKVADKSNLTSDAEYEFDVAAAREDGVWTFDDSDNRGQDTAVFDAERGEFLSAGQLTLSETGVLFAAGPHQEFGARDGDSALVARDKKIAWSEAPVIDTTASFVVSAHVKLDADAARTGWYTALSQEAPLYNGFRLGYRPSGCPTVEAGCWAFGVNRDVTTNATTYTMSKVPVQLGQWVHLLGEYDKPEGKLRLYVCDAGTPNAPAVGEPVVSVASMTANLPASPGRFVVGRGFIGGSPSNYWDGLIDNVRIFRGEVLAEAKIRRLCQGAEAFSYLEGHGVDDVDPTWGDDADENEATS
ncbi:concanavalin A-like lectin/glucanase superfamily protein [Isoptericola jiangsuensis]|uniref:Concanavalin A-like lectin/glucanase superfamily protein n=1 Tax=Isoptericola jiangsuensis TaxID=548579 RepID=A0A2A9EW81_9MICO|nr:LamG-like jellyroll fold domain-containing protein [Isoptericola jiangsuensis]PFG43377.1 concanavalin A-like lectin/glucanase superfamily protein [Isoptericola jiangsuensis]